MRITALIRTMPHRADLFERAYSSAVDQGCEVIVHSSEPVDDYSYNTICNELKAQVPGGFFLFLDDDDYILPGAIEKVSPHLEEGKALICQMLRNGIPKPGRAEISRGRIGLPCIILHHSFKDIGTVTAHETGDFDYIYSVTRQVPWKFVPIPVVNAGSRSRGK